MRAVSPSASLVGRRDQLRLLRDALDSASAGDPRFVVFGGEAGVGKTYVMEHHAARQDPSRVRVLRGACVELGTEGLALAPVTAALRDLVVQVGVERLVELLPGAMGLLRLLPELRDGEAGALDQSQLFELLAALLRRLGAEQPVLLLIDDLHWADRSTRELLGFLARVLRGARVMVTMAYRSDALELGHTLPAFLAELERLPIVRRVELGPFGRAETAELIAGVLGEPPPPLLLDRVFRLSAGNAFFVEELLRNEVVGTTERLPASVRELLLERVERLPEAAGRAVRTAAAGGSSIPHRLLADVAGLAEESLLAALRPAVDAHILIATREDGATYRFRHALVQEVVVDDLLPAESSRLHRAYAEALEATPGLVRAERLAAEVAFHWYGAGDAGRAVPALLRAAGVAEAMCAHAEQSQMLLRALDLWPRAAVAGQPVGWDRPAVWERIATAAMRAGDYAQALELIHRALAESDRSAHPERAAMLLALRCDALQKTGGEMVALDHPTKPGDASTAFEEAMGLLASVEALGRAKVLDVLGSVLMQMGRAAEGRGLSEEALRIAVDLGDEAVEASARTTLGVTLAQLGAGDEAIAELDRVRELAGSRGDTLRLARVHANLAFVLGSVGRHEESADLAQAGLDVARKAGLSRTFGSALLLCLAWDFMDTGRWDEAGASCADGLALDPPGWEGALLHAVRGEIARRRGQLDAAREQSSLAATLLGGTRGKAHEPVMMLEAEIALDENRIGDARRAILEALPLTADRLATTHAWRLLTTGARVEGRARLRAQVFHQERDDSGLVDALRRAAAELPSDAPPWRACAAQLAAELGDPAGSWPNVAAAWDAAGDPYWAAYARLRSAEWAVAAGDHETAWTWLRAARAQAEPLGATSLLALVAALAPTVGPAAVARPGRRDLPVALRALGLTAREVEVLRLMVAGRTNRQIAAQLFISPKTVSVHAWRILQKLGVTNRVQAAAAAHRLRLFDEAGGEKRALDAEQRLTEPGR
jgi:DNA-binding CsgD family transcriptional regulator